MCSCPAHHSLVDCNCECDHTSDRMLQWKERALTAEASLKKAFPQCPSCNTSDFLWFDPDTLTGKCANKHHVSWDPTNERFYNPNTEASLMQYRDLHVEQILGREETLRQRPDVLDD